MQSIPLAPWSKVFGWFALPLVAGALVFAISRSPGFFVGDSADYYSLYLAWKDTLRPFMTEASWAEYARRQPVESWTMAVPLELARHATGGLIVDDTGDFNHFWFYSMAAAAIGWTLERVFGEVSIHSSFVALHWLLLTMTSALAWKHFGWRGLASVALLTFLSPIVWFVDKVHTEFFTFTLVLSAVIVFLRGRYLAASFFLALASTQNISFAAVAMAPLAIDALSRRPFRFSLREHLVLAATAIVLALHPVYYLARHGVIEPQILRGGAKLGAQLSDSLVWFFDLDIGLFSNWPIGVGLLLLALWLRFGSGSFVAERRHWLWFVAAYLGLSLFAQSSTTNVNSGGTRSIARYATWYLPLFFPLVLMTLERMGSGGRVFRTVAGALLVAGGIFNLIEYRPSLDENSRSPTPVSNWVQEHLPGLYDPPAEIFSERYGGVGESGDLNRALAVIGPDCRKVLIFAGGGRTEVLGGAGCALVTERLRLALSQRLASLGPTQRVLYATLGDEEVNAARFGCPRVVQFGRGGNLPPSGSRGLGLPEARGRWTEGNNATFTCWVEPTFNGYPRRLSIATSAFVTSVHAQRLRLSVNEAPTMEIVYDKAWEAKKIDVDLPKAFPGRLRLRFEMPDAASPRELAMSPDPRRLGIFIESIEFKGRESPTAPGGGIVLRVLPGPQTPHTIGKFDPVAMAITSEGSEAGALMYGPYTRLPPGQYRATYVVTAQADADHSEVGALDASALIPGNPVVILAQVPLTAAPGEQTLVLHFEASNPEHVYQFRVWANGKGGRTSVKSVLVEKL
jgi:hypothetical protein